MLEKILEAKRADVERLKGYVYLDMLKERIPEVKPVRDLAAALRGEDNNRHARGPIKIIAEIKKSSPSCGVIRRDFHPFDLANTYQMTGAAALSVLTEETCFEGRLDYLTPIKNNLKLPVLRKDFLFDEYQIYESRAAGADAVLLIAAILEPSRLKDLYALATELGMASLVEVHDEDELRVALEAGARIVGINNRDLKTFTTDIKVTERLVPLIPDEVLTVSESGIRTIEDIIHIYEAGADAFLIGETLLRAHEPGTKLRELRGIGYVRPGDGPGEERA